MRTKRMGYNHKIRTKSDNLLSVGIYMNFALGIQQDRARQSSQFHVSHLAEELEFIFYFFVSRILQD